MENQSVVIWDRKQNMQMLSTLLEKVQEYNQMAGEVRKKDAEIESVNRKLAIPQKKIPLITKILAIVLCFTILVPVCAIVMYVKNKKDYQKNQQSLKATLEKLQAEYEELCAQLKKYETEVLNPSVEEYVPEHFPQKYVYNASALSFMLDLMTDLRADTIKEAINMYEAELRVNEVINSLHFRIHSFHGTKLCSYRRLDRGCRCFGCRNRCRSYRHRSCHGRRGTFAKKSRQCPRRHRSSVIFQIIPPQCHRILR